MASAGPTWGSFAPRRVCVSVSVLSDRSQSKSTPLVWKNSNHILHIKRRYHLCCIRLALWRLSEGATLISSEVDCIRLCTEIHYIHLSQRELLSRGFLRIWPALEVAWRWSPSFVGRPPAVGLLPAAGPPMGPTAGKQDLSDPPFWPETPLIRIQPLTMLLTHIYDGGLLLLLPTGATSHVQESHLAPEPWAIWSQPKVSGDCGICFEGKLGLNLRVLFLTNWLVS